MLVSYSSSYIYVYFNYVSFNIVQEDLIRLRGKNECILHEINF